MSGGLQPGLSFTGEARDLASDGAGVVRHDSGRIVFVPGLWRGERAVIEVVELRGRVALGRVLQIEQASAHRVQPPCPHHGFANSQCGGCPWMFVDYPEQLAAKQERIRRALERMAVDPRVIRDIAPSPDPLGYRRRAQLKTDGLTLGFTSAASNALAPIEDCVVLTPRLRQVLSELRSSLPRDVWRPRRGQGLVSLDLDESTSADGVRVNQRLPFAQANERQNAYMRAWLAQRVAAEDAELTALELFCGSGNFTSTLVDAGCRTILAADVNEEAIRDLRLAALPGVEAVACDLFDEGAVVALSGRAGSAELLLLDPPRDGFRHLGRLLEQLASLREVCYVSCDLATWQRDAVVLLESGFELAEVQPVDQFPQTPHVELLSKFIRG